MNAKASELYPSRYYATMDTPAHFWDAWDVSDLSVIPEASTMFSLTEAQWLEKGGETGLQKLKVVKGGELVDYVPAVTPQDLKSMAQAELSGWVAQQAALASAMGQKFSSDMKAYVRTLQSMASGAQGSPLMLPNRPSGAVVAE